MGEGSVTAQITTAFVGRTRELAEIAGIVDDGSRGRGRLLLLVGEPGIGKTSLAERVAALARDAGYGVAWGNARGGEGAPPFWPWIQLLRGAELSGRQGLLAELEGQGSAAPPVRASDATEARFRLFDRVVTALKEAAAGRPILLVLEDLHWADAASLRLLEFLEPQLRVTRLVFACTTRDDEPASGSLELTGDAVRLPIGGLSRSETAELAEAVAGRPLRPAVARRIHDRTAGSPLFTKELVRLLASQGRLDATGLAAIPHAIPATIRSVLERQLAQLGEECRSLLAEAAVLGHRFAAGVLAEMRQKSRADLGELLREAHAAQILEETAEEQWSFSHALLRETLYSGLPHARRKQLHGHAARALSAGAGPGGAVAEVAHHLRMWGGDTAEAVACTRRAADAASRQLAHDEAVRQYEDALEILHFASGEEPLRCDLLLGLGDALLGTGDTEGARTAFLDAATTARSVGDFELLVRAVLGYGAVIQYAGFSGADQTCVDLIEEALLALPAGPTPLRMELLTRLAHEVYYVDRRRLETVGREVETLAPHLDDTASRARALSVRRMLVIGMPNPAERRRMADEVVELAEAAGDLELALYTRAHRVADSIELGDVADVEAEAASITRRAQELRLSSWLWFPTLWRATLAILEGRLDRAEELATEALQLGEPRGLEAIDHYGIQLMSIRREQDRLGELEPLIRDAIDQYPYIASYRCVLALAEAEAGRHAAARTELDRLAADDFTAIPVDYNFTISAVLCAETAALLGDATAAAALRERLEPYAGLYVNVALGGLCYGSIDRFLGLLEETCGRRTDAERYFEAAIERNARIGAAPLVARTRYELARMLLRRGTRLDEERALGLLGKATEAVRDLGLSELGRKIEELRPSQAVPEGNVFRRDGEIWTIAYGGRSVRLKDSKGLRDVAVLLARPGAEVHVLDLVAAQEGMDPRRSLAGVLGHRGDEILDDTARAAYRERAEELRQEIVETESFGDPVRAERARDELEALGRELGSAYGLGGRARPLADAADRARKAVSARIRDAIRRIADDHPELGRHLDRSVRTGAFCAYEPDVPVSWTL